LESTTNSPLANVLRSFKQLKDHLFVCGADLAIQSDERTNGKLFDTYLIGR
jgi:hypothetical protein